LQAMMQRRGAVLGVKAVEYAVPSTEYSGLG